MSGADGGFPLPTIIDPPRVCVRLNIPNEREHIAAFWGALWLLTYWNEWRRDEAHTGAAVGLVWKEVIYEAWQLNEGYTGCAGGDTLDIRQSTTNPCQLEKSTDGGETWALAFDYSLCTPSLLEDIFNVVSATRGTQIENFTILQINPSAPTLTWGAVLGESVASNEDRAQALCALAQWIATGASEMLAQTQEANITAANITGAVFGIGALVALAFPPFAAIAAVKWAAFGVLAAAGGLALSSELTGGDVGILRDPDIREFLACEIYKDLNAKPITEASLATFLGGSYSCATSDEQRAVLLMRQMFVLAPRRRELFNSMVDYLGDVTAAQKAGLLGASCVCPTDNWSVDLDLEDWFALSAVGDNYYGGTNNCTGGVVGQIAGAPVAGRWDSIAGLGGQGVARRLRIFMPASTTVTQVHVTAQNIVALGGNNLNIMSNGNRRCTNYSAGSASNVYNVPAVSGQQWDLGVSTFGAATGDGALRITMVRISGTGVPLFGGC